MKHLEDFVDSAFKDYLKAIGPKAELKYQCNKQGTCYALIIGEDYIEFPEEHQVDLKKLDKKSLATFTIKAKSFRANSYWLKPTITGTASEWV